MAEFVATALGFPTLVYSIVLAVCLVYWLLAATGLADIDLGGLDVPDLGESGLVGMLGRVGLDRLPMMLVVTLVTLIGWFLTYFVHLFLLLPLSGWSRWLLGAAVLLATFIASVLIASAVLRPVRRWLLSRRTPVQQSLLGQIAVVRSPQVTAQLGTADLNDGGAGLILQIRSDTDLGLQRGDRVVLVEFDAAAHAYRVIAENTYRTL